MGRLVPNNRQATVTCIRTGCNQGMKKVFYSSRGPLLSDKNRKLGPQFAQAGQKWKIQISAWILVISPPICHRPWVLFLPFWLQSASFRGCVGISCCFGESLSFFDPIRDSLLIRDFCITTMVSVWMLCGLSPVGHLPVLCNSLCLSLSPCLLLYAGKGQKHVKVKRGGMSLPNTRLYQEAFMRLVPTLKLKGQPTMGELNI